MRMQIKCFCCTVVIALAVTAAWADTPNCIGGSISACTAQASADYQSCSTNCAPGSNCGCAAIYQGAVAACDRYCPLPKGDDQAQEGDGAPLAPTTPFIACVDCISDCSTAYVLCLDGGGGTACSRARISCNMGCNAPGKGQCTMVSQEIIEAVGNQQVPSQQSAASQEPLDFASCLADCSTSFTACSTSCGKNAGGPLCIQICQRAGASCAKGCQGQSQ